MLLDIRLPVRYIFRDILPDIARVLLISLMFQLVKQFYGDYLPRIPLQLPTVLGGSISLLLAFKISQSYERWWEARRLWGAIVNDSRTLVLQVSCFVKNEGLPPSHIDSPVRGFAYRQMAWCYSLGQTLRGLNPMHGLEDFLFEPEIAYLHTHHNKPLALMALHSQHLQRLYDKECLTPFQQVQIDSTLVRLTEAMGGAERIKNTVFPASYRLLVYFFIYLFLLTLSLGLVETIGPWEVPVLLAIASTYFLLERTARYLQDPFDNKATDTPVTAIARTVEINLKQLLQDENVPAPQAPERFYLM